MKKKSALILGIILLIQSCSVYKPTTSNEIKEGRNYIITMDSGKEFEARCTGIANDGAYFGINDTNVLLPFDKMADLKRKKVSPLILIGGSAAALLVGILVIKKGTKENIVGEE